MRFSLRTLFLLFTLAGLLSYGLALVIAYVQVVPERPGSRIDQMMIEMNVHLLEEHTKKTGLPINVQKLESWLQGKLNPSDADGRVFTALGLQHSDHWNRPFHAVALSPADIPLPQVTLAAKFGMYSTGRDGRTLTHGLDEDDLNTWDKNYRKAIDLGQAWVNERAMEESANYLPWTLGVVVAILAVIMRSKSIKAPPSPGNNANAV